MPFLPVQAHEVDSAPAIVMITGEAYIDHPSFGQAIVSRLVESMGFSVAIIPQPQTDADFMRFGVPEVGFFVTSGVVDSMVNNYTVAKRPRAKDVYSEGGKTGMRPDRATTAYCRTLKRLYPDSAVIAGGIEPSLRRFAHYDYWDDKVMPSVLLDSGADLIIYGMGERPLKDIFKLVSKGALLKNIKDVRGTCYASPFEGLSARLKKKIEGGEAVFCHSYEEVKGSKTAYLKAFNIQSRENDFVRGRVLLQKHGDIYVVQNPPQTPLTEAEMDGVYALPYMRDVHPMYKDKVPAIEEVKFSIASSRGCFGGCNYCALTYHQGKVVQKRSKESILAEAEFLKQDKDFKGYIHDVGGPTANFRDPACGKQLGQDCGKQQAADPGQDGKPVKAGGVCADKSCIGYKKCPNLVVSHSEYTDILKALREIEGIKKVFIRSGIRFDYVMYDEDEAFMRELVEHHVSGQLKVAPEHCSEEVLKLMNKPSFDVYLAFKERFDTMNRRLKKKQYLVPYLISSHPGSTLKDAIELALYLKSIGYMPEQVQDFYPTPGSKSTTMYYTELNPDTGKPVFVPKTREEKRMQRALLQYRKKENRSLVTEALTKAGREDLISVLLK